MVGGWGWMGKAGFWLAVLVALGLGLRAYHYLRDPVLWHDEAALVLNVLGKDFAGQFGPLYFSEASPPLFSCLEKVVVLGLGDGTLALRLIPFLASCAAFVLTVLLARRLLPAAAVLWLTLLMGCSDRLLWHACEAKPYAVDVLVAVLLLALFVPRAGVDDAAGLGRKLLILALVSPVLIFLSFPSCFLLGGAALALLPAVLRGGRSVWALYGLFGVLLCGSFVLLYLGPVRAQKDDHMLSCWAHLFPQWQQPWMVPVTGVVRLTELVRYALEPVGNLLTPVAVVGGVTLWRAGRRRLVMFLLAPVGLVLLAWLLGQYPVGAVRVVVFAAPAALLLVAAGLPPTLAWLRRFWLAPAVVAVVLVPVGVAGYRAAVCWPRLDSATPAEFVLQQRRAGEPVVGIWWEQAYYLRELGPLYRPLHPGPKEPPAPAPTAATGDGAVRRVWLLAVTAENAQRQQVRALGAGDWGVVAGRRFRDVTVLCLERHDHDGR